MRFLVILSCLVLLVVSAALGLLLGPATYAKLHGMNQLLYLESYFERLPLALTPARYNGLRYVITGIFGGSLVASAGLLLKQENRREVGLLWMEASGAGRVLRQMVVRLTKGEVWTAAGLLGLILSARTLLLVHYGFRYDELLSYVFFVREGPVVISSFYPLPNNHVFFNLCCSLLAPLLGHAPLLVMRLPSFVAAAVGTVLSYALLARQTNFKLATLITGLFNLTPAALYYAASGRGYYLQFVFLQLGFFAIAGMGSSTRYRRLGWLVFIVSGILGLYTIPTYAYPLASLLLGAVLVLGPRPGRLGRQWPELLVVALLIGTTATLLYAPVGAVSGWSRLLGNSYVQPASWATFRGLALANIYEKLQIQFGLVRPVLVAGGALLLLTPLVLLRAPVRPALRSVAWVTWAMLTAPMFLVVAQRAYPPIRAVVYLAYFGFLLAALAGWFWAEQRPHRFGTRPVQWGLIAVVVLGTAAFRFGGVLARIRSSQHEEVQLTRAWQWLEGRHPSRVLLGSYQLFFYYYALQGQQAVVLADRPLPGQRYDYLVLPAAQQAAPVWTRPLSYQAVYRNDLVSIFALANPTRQTP